MHEALADAVRRELRRPDLEGDVDLPALLAGIRARAERTHRRNGAAALASVVVVLGVVLSIAEVGRGDSGPPSPERGTQFGGSVSTATVSVSHTESRQPSTEVPTPDAYGHVFYYPDGQTRLLPGDPNYPRNARVTSSPERVVTAPAGP